MTKTGSDFRSRLEPFDALVITAVMLLAVGYWCKYLDFDARPYEDAAMLMRYSLHLAQGHGIVWNVGDKPIDGATDFLFMVTVAGLTKLGAPLESSVQSLTFGSHLLTIVLIYCGLRTLHGARAWVAALSAVYLAIGPGVRYIEAYFGTTFFALFVALAWFFAHRVASGNASLASSLLFAISSLLMGLTRPEGALLAIFMLGAIAYATRGTRLRTLLIHFAVLFVLPGVVYFLWRWQYFGQPLPNPFYVKGGGSLHWTSLRASVGNAVTLCLPFTWAFLLAFHTARGARQALFSLIPVGGFVSSWVLLSNTMNYMERFQYAVLPIVLLSWYPLARDLVEDWNLLELSGSNRRTRRTIVFFLLVVSIACLVHQHGRINVHRFPDGRYDMGMMLAGHSSRAYTMATTEAGLLPLYSNWQAIDAFGLNDQWIARKGEITESYLDHHEPELIVFHARFSPLVAVRGRGVRARIVQTLKEYSERNGYILAAAFGVTPYDTHYYYVRPDFPESAEIGRKIQNLDYIWPANGLKSINYAACGGPDSKVAGVVVPDVTPN